MNININIGVNQGVININSVEFTGNSSESTENARDREDKEKMLFGSKQKKQQEKKGKILLL